MNQMINNESNVNYDMQQLMNITGQTAMNINNMSRQLGVVASAVDSIRTDVDRPFAKPIGNRTCTYQI